MLNKGLINVVPEAIIVNKMESDMIHLCVRMLFQLKLIFSFIIYLLSSGIKVIVGKIDKKNIPPKM